MFHEVKSDIGDDDVKSLCKNDTKALKELYLGIEDCIQLIITSRILELDTSPR